MRFLSDRAIPGVEVFDGGTFRRSIRTRHGRAVVIGLTPHPTRSNVTFVAAIDDPTDLADAVRASRRLLDLDADPVSIDTALSADPALGPLVRATPGLRLPGAIDGFEVAVRAILGQQISVRAARTLAGRIVTRAGTTLARDEAIEGVTHLFPTPEQLAAAPLEGLGLTRRRVETIHRLAELVASGELVLAEHADRQAIRDALLAVPGIGPWTVAYISMRALGDPDAFPASDLGVREGFHALGLPTTASAITDHAERWRPWRGYAVMHLWNTEALAGEALAGEPPAEPSARPPLA
jgi:AraC family transcriptional regulator of adaptative response / DNA-3-methyladenine glycosylase II